VTLLFVVLAFGVVASVAVLIARGRPVLAPDPTTAPAFDWPPGGTLAPASLDAVRFGVVVRGYRMEQVDRVLDDARDAIAARDARITALEARVDELVVAAPPPQDGAVAPPEGGLLPGVGDESAAAEEPGEHPAAEGDAAEGDAAVGDAAEGDAAVGDAAEGDAAEGDAAEGDAAEGDAAVGDAAEGEPGPEGEVGPGPAPTLTDHETGDEAQAGRGES
jgi:DivIVA domain-containing protein